MLLLQEALPITSAQPCIAHDRAPHRRICLQIGGQQAAVARTVRPRVATRAAATDTKLARTAVPLELEEGPMPLNTYNNKAPFKARVKSVERIVGPKATGETCNIVIETEGKIPFWEGQSYGVIPPVRDPGRVGAWWDQGTCLEVRSRPAPGGAAAYGGSGWRRCATAVSGSSSQPGGRGADTAAARGAAAAPAAHRRTAAAAAGAVDGATAA